VSSTPLKLLIVDDNDLFVSALEGFLETEASLEVIGRAANGAVAVELAADLQPDVVLMDLSMPSVDGFEATAMVREQAPEAAIVVLTGSDDPADQERARTAGAAGYITKDRILGELVATIHSVTSPP
jgi:two-component system, NarL family, nitrate/nitrite response regulator NarL